MAGFRVFSFDWAVFADLTSNPQSEIPSALAEKLVDEKTRKKLRLPSRLPKTGDKLSALIRDLFLKPEWYDGQPASEIKLRNPLLFAMFEDPALKSIGLRTTPAWRKFHEDCAFNLGYLLSGQAIVNLERTKHNKGLFIQMVGDAEPGENAFWWFGNRPYRHGSWQGSNEDQWELEEEYGCIGHSIQSPQEVHTLASQLAEESRSYKQLGCQELDEMLSDYEYCIEGVRGKDAGMLVEVET